MKAMKLTSDSFLYQSFDYGRELHLYLTSADVIDKNSASFADIAYDIKMRQVSPIIMKVLMSNKVVLLLPNKGVSRALKVMYAKNVTSIDKNDKKVYIDCSGIITFDNGKYKCKSIMTLVSYILTAMVYIIYYEKPELLLNDITVAQASTDAFVDMMLYILGYLKVPVTLGDNKERMSFAIAEYFLYCVFGKDNEDIIFNIAKKSSKIKDKKDCDYYHTRFYDAIDSGKGNIDTFLKKFAEVFLGQKEDGSAVPGRASLTTDTFVQRWMYSFGAGTFLGLELFVPFTEIITDCYVGAYINQQNTIEKVVGSKNVVRLTNQLLKIGSDA